MSSLVCEDVGDAPDTSTSLPTPSSPTIVMNYYNFLNSVYSPYSNLHAPTLNNGGSQNSGCESDFCIIILYN